ncbi:Uncharacterised protein [Helicobacter fennelliae]|uniref:Uncharacterized protein n=1 Tax=Helicobacter fennelliae TaxID=215 RepID=A0A2X3BG21_9HELI|nr:Uncharacterised protein [Helicobacter fennelliae]STP07273.1 Uncharacterised protein [Helicobacter fennelliae]STQ85143.1 Uncharacterised protein [Helicobacter fennelliae]
MGQSDGKMLQRLFCLVLYFATNLWGFKDISKL